MSRQKEIRWDIYNSVVVAIRHLFHQQGGDVIGTVDRPLKRVEVLSWIREHAGVPVQDMDRDRWRVKIPEELAKLTDRSMRRTIQSAVSSGAWPTVLSSGGGIYLARDAQEIHEARDYLESRIKALGARLAGLYKAEERAALEAYAHGEPGQATLFPERRTS